MCDQEQYKYIWIWIWIHFQRQTSLIISALFFFLLVKHLYIYSFVKCHPSWLVRNCGCLIMKMMIMMMSRLEFVHPLSNGNYYGKKRKWNREIFFCLVIVPGKKWKFFFVLQICHQAWCLWKVFIYLFIFFSTSKIFVANQSQQETHRQIYIQKNLQSKVTKFKQNKTKQKNKHFKTFVILNMIFFFVFVFVLPCYWSNNLSCFVFFPTWKWE